MSVFEVLASNDHERLTANSRAEIAAAERAKTRFANFIANAADEAEAEQRRFLIEDEVRAIGEAAAAEYGSEEPVRATYAAWGVLGAHDSDCECGFCANKGKLPGAKKDEDGDDGKSDESKASGDSDDKDDSDDDSGKPWEKDSRWAVVGVELSADEQGDHYQRERVNVQGESGPVPKIDKSKSGDEKGWTTEPIDVGSVRNRSDGQDPHDIDQWKAEEAYEDGPIVLVNENMNADPFAENDPLVKTVDADEPIGSEEKGETGSWTAEQTPAVTSRYHVLATED